MIGFALYKDPNQYIFNLGWLNITEYNPEQHTLREFLSDFITRTAKRLSVLLVASHKVQNLILDVSLLVNMKVTNESIVEMIRDALVDAEFRCESLTILWPLSVPQEEMAKLLSHMWGDEDAEWPAVDLEADYDADDPGDPDRTHTITTTETEPDFEWAIALRELGLSEEYIAKFEDIPTLRITPESAVLPWSPEVDSPNPFIAVQKALLSDRDRNRKALSSEAYWVGSEEAMKYLPNTLLSCLRKTEKAT